MGNAIVAMGVSEAGKSSVGLALAMSFGIPFVDAGDLHAPDSIARIAAGQPLTDDDRWPWLSRGASHLVDTATYPGGGVVASSAVKCAYRDRIRTGAGGAAMFVLLRHPARDRACTSLRAQGSLRACQFNREPVRDPANAITG